MNHTFTFVEREQDGSLSVRSGQWWSEGPQQDAYGRDITYPGWNGRRQGGSSPGGMNTVWLVVWDDTTRLVRVRKLRKNSKRDAYTARAVRETGLDHVKLVEVSAIEDLCPYRYVSVLNQWVVKETAA